MALEQPSVVEVGSQWGYAPSSPALGGGQMPSLTFFAVAVRQFWEAFRMLLRRAQWN